MLTDEQYSHWEKIGKAARRQGLSWDEFLNPYPRETHGALRLGYQRESRRIAGVIRRRTRYLPRVTEVQYFFSNADMRFLMDIKAADAATYSIPGVVRDRDVELSYADLELLASFGISGT